MKAFSRACNNPSRISSAQAMEQDQYEAEIKVDEVTLVLAGDVEKPSVQYYTVRCPLCGLVEVEDIDKDIARALIMSKVKIRYLLPTDAADTPFAAGYPISSGEIVEFSKKLDVLEAHVSVELAEQFDQNQ